MDDNINKDLNEVEGLNENINGNSPLNKQEDNKSQNKGYEYGFWADQRNNYSQGGYQQHNTNYQGQNGNYQQQYGNYNQQAGFQQNNNDQRNNYSQQGYNQSNINYNYQNYSQQNGAQYNKQNGNPMDQSYHSYQQPNYYDYQSGNYNQPYYNQPVQKLPPREKKEQSKVLRWIGKAAIFGVVASVIFLGIHGVAKAINPEFGLYKQSNNLNGNRTYKISTTKTGSVEYKDYSAISQMVENTMPAIVSIHSVTTETGYWFGQQINQDSESSGSGIIVGKDEEELLIATNNHVVSGANKITITFIDDSEAEAVIKGTDVAADLAVVSVDISSLEKSTVDAIHVASMGDSDKVKVGEVAVAIGNALGYGQSVTVGYISAKDREITVSDGYNNYDMLLLQTDAAINAGNSGGALLNIEGELIGINSVKYASSAVEGMGFAIPITRAIPIIKELMSREILKESEQGYLGIRGTEITEDISQQLQMPIGVYIGEVVEGGAASKGGLRKADIITSVNGIEITSMIQLREYVTSFRVGTEIEVTIMRNINGVYEEQVIPITLGANPELSTEE